MKLHIIVGLIIVMILGTGVFLYIYFNNRLEIAEQNTAMQEKGKSQNQNSVKVGYRKFRFESFDKSVLGDGSLMFDGTKTTFTVRLITAPKLSSGEHYEAYMFNPGQDPIYMAELREINTSSQKYLVAGIGVADWYKMETVIITKRKSAGKKPGSIIIQAPVMPEEQFMR